MPYRENELMSKTLRIQVIVLVPYMYHMILDSEDKVFKLSLQMKDNDFFISNVK